MPYGIKKKKLKKLIKKGYTYVAIDSNDEMYAFRSRPVFSPNCGMWLVGNGIDCKSLGEYPIKKNWEKAVKQIT